MIGALFVLAAREFAGARPCARAMNRRAPDTTRAADEMAAAIERAWMGWKMVPPRLRSRRPAGRQPSQCRGRRFSSSRRRSARWQASAPHPGTGDRALQSVSERLACEFGIQLLDPPYRGYRPELGEISTYLPGYKENGSVFCHTNPWMIIAEAMRGRADKAMAYLRAIAPTYQTNPDRRRTEPYVYAQMIAGMQAANPGEGRTRG